MTLSLFSACSEKIEAPLIIFTAEPEFNIDLYENSNIQDGSVTFGIWIESIKNQDFDNYTIQAEATLNGNIIDVQILGINPPAIGKGAAAKAKTFLPIGQLAAGEYQFNLTLGQTIRNSGQLKVENGQYSLNMPSPQGVVLQNMILKSIPQGHIWGYADASTDLLKPLAEQFISELKTITTDHSLAPGYYSYFTVSGAGSIFLHSSLDPQKAALLFVRQLDVPIPQLKNIITPYRSGTTPLPLRCLSTQGEL